MAMSMQELLYGEREPAYFVHYGRQTSIPYAHDSQQFEPAQSCSRQVESGTFGLTVPMCCTGCEDRVQETLLGLRGVRDVVCDRYNQRVIITGHMDPARAVKQVDRVRNGAALWSRSSYSKHRYETNSSSPVSRRGQHDNRECTPYVADHCDLSSGDSYYRSHCPAHRLEPATTHYVSINQSFATRVEMQC